MNLVEQSLWWILPAALIAGFMVYAMMEFTLLLILKPGRGDARADTAELEKRLMALNTSDKPYRLIRGSKSDLELDWKVVDASWYELFAKIKLTMQYGARMLFDEETGAVRWYESLRTSSIFLGFEGWKPKFNLAFYWRGGYLNVIWHGLAYGIPPGFPPRIGKVHEFHLDTIDVKNDIRPVIQSAGWDFRPVTLSFKTNRRWLHLTRVLRPAWLHRIPERRLWGTLYVGSFVLFYLYVFVVVTNRDMDWTWEAAWPAAIVALGWWAIWGLLVWMLTGFPGLGRRKGRSYAQKN